MVNTEVFQACGVGWVNQGGTCVLEEEQDQRGFGSAARFGKVHKRVTEAEALLEHH